uniref:Protein BANP n=1 Tax=Ixodes ricinus TaxID=34613 RepID=A0A131Y2X1_IXORI
MKHPNSTNHVITNGEESDCVRLAKRPRTGDMDQPLSVLLESFKETIFSRLETLESRIDALNEQCQTLEDKIDILSTAVKENVSTVPSSIARYVHLPSSAGSPTIVSLDEEPGTTFAAGSSVTLITLNTEADFPHGSWLGDENNPEVRVRCPISPTTLFHINTTCTTPEKMALTLLDHLFDRETQACSNISGSGKHKKQRLDPLMIYGIRCHLTHLFEVTNADWDRIKLNIDSKCRTAFRRKKKGLPLNTKVMTSSLEVSSSTAQTSSVPPSDVSDDSINSIELVPQASEFCTFSLQTIEDGTSEDAELAATVPEGQVFCTEHGDFQVVHATPEQLAQIQQTHQLQILSGSHILATSVDGSPEDTATVTIIPQEDLINN